MPYIRTREQQDWITLYTSDYVPLPEEYPVDASVYHMPHTSMDHTINTCGQMLIDTCIATGIRLVNGRLGKDKEVGYMPSNGYSVVDYVFVEHAVFREHTILLKFRTSCLSQITARCVVQYAATKQLSCSLNLKLFMGYFLGSNVPSFQSTLWMKGRVAVPY